MSWNYRVIKHSNENETWYGIHEVYYGTNDQPHSWTEDSIVISDSPEGLRLILSSMMKCLDKEILGMEQGKLKVSV